MNFKPVRDFECEELKSIYCKGLSYTVRQGNDKLRALVAQLVKDGKVRIYNPTEGGIRGTDKQTTWEKVKNLWQ